MGQIWIVAKQFGFCSFTEAKVLGAVGHRLRDCQLRQGTWCHCVGSLSDRFGPFGSQYDACVSIASIDAIPANPPRPWRLCG